MKFPIKWHRESFNARLKNAERRKQDLLRLQEEVARNDREIEFYAQQLLEAERRGMTEFDNEKLLVKRRKS